MTDDVGDGASVLDRWFAAGSPVRSRVGDVVLAVVVAAVQLGGTAASAHGDDEGWSLGVVAVVLLVTGPVGLLVRRMMPVVSLGVAFAAGLAFPVTQSGEPDWPGALLAFLVAVFSAVLAGRRAAAWGALGVGFATLVWLPAVVSDERSPDLGEVLAVAAWLLVWGTVPEILRVRGERRAEAARRRASEERLLIARELHDVLAHNMSLINVQSGVALHLLDVQLEHVPPALAAVRPALAAIKDASREALGELHSVLDVLRRGEDGAQLPLGPTAGLRDLEALVGRTRAAGLDVRLDVEGEVGPLPAGVDLAAFRIAQEALTNVVRHAGDASAVVRLVYGSDELTIQVTDDGRGAVAAGASGAAANGSVGGAGRGIRGMRERARALGGTFDAGPRPGRGFRVRARFPVEGSRIR